MVAEPSTWVVDASVAFGWFAAVPGSDQAILLLNGGPATVLLAPDLVLVELLNAAWKSLRLGAITAEQFQVLAHRAAEPFSRWIPSSASLARAEQERATLITADQRLLRKLAQPRPGQPAVMDLASLPAA